MINKSAITFDVDWAPDWVVEDCVDMCVSRNIPVTVFVTHQSSILKDLLTDSNIEVGIHPNFLQGSSHGSTIVEVLDYCMDLVPTAKSMRTHGLVQTTQLFGTIADCYTSIEIDVSLFLPNHPFLEPVNMYYGASERCIKRIPYFWEDDCFAMDPNHSWDLSVPILKAPGYQVFDFHPIHVAANMSSLKGYNRLKRIKKVVDFSRKDVASICNYKAGCKTLLQRLLTDTPIGQFHKISDIDNVGPSIEASNTMVI